MKKLLCWTLLCLTCLLPVLAVATPESYFPWMETVLHLDWADEEEPQQGWTVPEGQRLVRLHFSAGEYAIPTEDINANTEAFKLRDAAKNDYAAAVLQMQGVKFDPETGTFSTDDTQEGFDLIFTVPEGVDIANLDLLVPTGKAGETIVVHLKNLEPRPTEAAAE